MADARKYANGRSIHHKVTPKSLCCIATKPESICFASILGNASAWTRIDLKKLQSGCARIG
jgi:hypothetical protein